MGRAGHGRSDPVLAGEVGTLLHRAAKEVVLCYPNTYRVAGASLGFQVVYRALNSRPSISCQRAVLADDAFTADAAPPVRTLEHGMPLGEFSAILFSIAYELDIPHVAEMLRRSGIAPLADDRDADAPPIIAGGPLTQSNVLPLGPFVDAVVVGEAEDVLQVLLDLFERDLPKADLLRELQDVRGVWLPSVHGNAVPDVLAAYGAHIPARGQWFSDAAEFRDMALLETSRGCPRYCKFCVVRAPVSPMRSPELERVVAALDEAPYLDAPRIGFVGAAVSDWPFIKGALAAAVDTGKGVGISSLRADKLDEEFVSLLVRGGFRSMTVASDAASQRMRGKMMKGLRERHFIGAAQLAAAAGMRAMKLYVILGLPGERDDDLDELIDLCLRIAAIIPLAITISPFVPKLHTPLAEAPFEPIKTQMKKLKRVQRALSNRVDVRFDSPRWAWIEYRLSQGGMETGRAAWRAWQAGGEFSAYKRAFRQLDDIDPKEERSAVFAAVDHALWPLTGAR